MFFYRIGYYDSYFRSSDLKYEKKLIKKPYKGNKRDYIIFAGVLKKRGNIIYKSLIRYGKVQRFSTLEFKIPLKSGKNIRILTI